MTGAEKAVESVQRFLDLFKAAHGYADEYVFYRMPGLHGKPIDLNFSDLKRLVRLATQEPEATLNESPIIEDSKPRKTRKRPDLSVEERERRRQRMLTFWAKRKQLVE